MHVTIQQRFIREMEGVEFEPTGSPCPRNFPVNSPVSRNSAAKGRESMQSHGNGLWSKCLASATVCNTVKMETTAPALNYKSAARPAESLAQRMQRLFTFRRLGVTQFCGLCVVGLLLTLNILAER